MNRHRLILFLLSLCVAKTATARNKPEKVCSPLYFGPNAMPALPFDDALVPEKMRVTLMGDAFRSYSGEWTFNPSFVTTFPFASHKMSLNVWGVPCEYYRNAAGEPSVAGGDLYVSTDIQMSRGKRFVPDLVVRVGIKSASGGRYRDERYFDSPGYFFDAVAARSIPLGNGYFGSLRVVGNIGFLCWQLGDSMQEDALSYGGIVRLVGRRLNIEAQIAGYSGNRNDGDHLCSVAAKATWTTDRFDLFADYGRGLRDYPFERFRIGISVPIIKLDRNQK